jgi:hypothetical protein
LGYNGGPTIFYCDRSTMSACVLSNVNWWHDATNHFVLPMTSGRAMKKMMNVDCAMTYHATNGCVWTSWLLPCESSLLYYV